MTDKIRRPLTHPVQRTTAGEGEAICPECEGWKLVLVDGGEFAEVCRPCRGAGAVKVCKYCGQPDAPTARRSEHSCPGKNAAQRAEWHARDVARWHDPEWALLYDCEPISMDFRASRLIEWFDEDHAGEDWSPSDALPAGAEAELDALLKGWCEKYGQDLGLEPDMSRPVMPPEVEAGEPAEVER